MSESVVAAQRRAFLGWTNAKVSQAAIEGGLSADSEFLAFSRAFPLQSLEDLFAGSARDLWTLLAAICEKQKPIRPRGIVPPAETVQEQQNNEPSQGRLKRSFAARGVVEYCLQHLQSVEGIKLVNIGATDLTDQNEKLILGFVWTLIKHYQNVDNEMLRWVNSLVQSVEGTVGAVSNFKNAWRDGRAFAALTNATLISALGQTAAAPHILRYPTRAEVPTLNRADAIDLMTRTFAVAHDALRIPQLLDATMVCDAPDDLAIQTYVSFFRVDDTQQSIPSHDTFKCLTDLGNSLLAIAAVAGDSFACYSGPVHFGGNDNQLEAPEVCKQIGCHGSEPHSLLSGLQNYINKVQASSAKADSMAQELAAARAELAYTNKTIAELQRVSQVAQERVKAVSSEASGALAAMQDKLAETERKLARERVLTQDGATMVLSLTDQIGSLKRVIEKLKAEQNAASSRLQVVELKSAQAAEFMDADKVPPSYHSIPPPVSSDAATVTLCFTDVQDSTAQWEAYPETMAAALRRHNEIIRRLISEYHGYEVKTEGDAFMVAFQNALDAAKWAMDVQRALQKANWPAELLRSDNVVAGAAIDDSLGFRGLRVRIGMHSGKPQASKDPVTGRMDYFGRMVNKAARIEGLACGGHIVMSADSYCEIQDRVAELSTPEPPLYESLGRFKLKGIDGESEAWLLLAAEHRARKILVQPPQTAVEKSKGADDMISSLKEANDALKQQLMKAQAELSAAQQSIMEFVAKMAANDDGSNPSLSGILAAVAAAQDEASHANQTKTEEPDPLQVAMQKLRQAEINLKDQEKDLRTVQKTNSALESDIAAALERVRLAEIARHEAELEARRLKELEQQREHTACVKLAIEIEQQLPKIRKMEKRATVIAAALASPSDPALVAAISRMMPEVSVASQPVTLRDIEALAVAHTEQLQTALKELADLREKLRYVHTAELNDEGAVKAAAEETRLDQLVRLLAAGPPPMCPSCESRLFLAVPLEIRRTILREDRISDDSEDTISLSSLNSLFDTANAIRQAVARAETRERGPTAAEAQERASALLRQLEGLLQRFVRAADGSIYHRSHFVCSHLTCGKAIREADGYGFADADCKRLLCRSHAEANEIPARLVDTCSLCRCGVTIDEEFVCVAPDNTILHKECLICSHCGEQMDEFGVADGLRLCPNCMPDEIAMKSEQSLSNLGRAAMGLENWLGKLDAVTDFYPAQRSVIEARKVRAKCEAIPPGVAQLPNFPALQSDSFNEELKYQHVLRYKYMSQDVLAFAAGCLQALEHATTVCSDIKIAQILGEVSFDLAETIEESISVL